MALVQVGGSETGAGDRRTPAQLLVAPSSEKGLQDMPQSNNHNHTNQYITKKAMKESCKFTLFFHSFLYQIFNVCL